MSPIVNYAKKIGLSKMRIFGISVADIECPMLAFCGSFSTIHQSREEGFSWDNSNCC